MPPTDIPDVGRFAMVADPGGAAFYVMTPKPPRGRAAADAAGGHARHLSAGTSSMSATARRRAFDFYSGQFGWETIAEMDMGAMGKYRIFGA